MRQYEFYIMTLIVITFLLIKSTVHPSFITTYRLLLNVITLKDAIFIAR